MKPPVSLLVTAWNRPALLKPFFERLWATTDYPYELIVHDDGSKDETAQWLFEQCRAGRISTLITNPRDHNRGRGPAVNRCADVAEGDYLLLLDGDEAFTRGWLAPAVRAMEEFPEIVLLHTSHYFKNGRRDMPIEEIEWDLEPYTLHRETRNEAAIRVVWVGPGGAFMVRRKTWLERGPWNAEKNPAFSDDMEYRLRLCPMMRLLAISNNKKHPPVTDLAAHWAAYKDSPWLAVLDPPTVSYHPGQGLCSIGASLPTMKDGPRVLGAS